MSTPWRCLEANGVDVKLFQVDETLSDEVLTKMQAPAKPDIPVITSEQLTEPDGIILGIPTRFGIFPAQMKAFLDSTGKLWASGALSGKFVGTFFSTASQHGGQETTALNAVTYFAHHGMMYVPFGFAHQAMFDVTEVVGGSAYGAGTITNGDGSRQPSEKELAIAKQQGETFAKIVTTYQNGKSKLLAAEAPKDSENLLAAGTATAAAGAGAAVAASQASTHGDPATSSTHTDVNVPVAGATTNTSTTATTSDTINKDNVGTTTSQPTSSQDVTAAKADQPAASQDVAAAQSGQPTPSQDIAAAAKSSQPTDAPATNQQPGAGPSEKPKKKKKFFFCCGNPDDLD